MLHIRLFHGRTDPKEDMSDWGFDGPVFGPYTFVHTTYSCHIKLCKSDGLDELTIFDGMVYYDECYYGDWSIFDESIKQEVGFSLSNFDSQKAILPNQ